MLIRVIRAKLFVPLQPNSEIMHIAVAGNIGSGKSTLTRLLAKHYGWEPRFESVDSNPYLEDYYRDIHRWSFNMEVYFLKERFRDLIDIAKADHTIIQDRTVYEGVHVFMENNREMGNLSERDYETYMELFEQMMSVVARPHDISASIGAPSGKQHPEARARLRAGHTA